VLVLLHSNLITLDTQFKVTILLTVHIMNLSLLESRCIGTQVLKLVKSRTYCTLAVLLPGDVLSSTCGDFNTFSSIPYDLHCSRFAPSYSLISN